MPRENEPPKPPQNRDNPETPPQRREAEDSAQKERQGLMEYSEKDEEKLLKQLEKFVIKGERDEYSASGFAIDDFINRHGIKNPLPLFRKLLERLTPEQALVLSRGIDASQDNGYLDKLREKIKIGVTPDAILRHADSVLFRYFSGEEAGKIVKKAIFILQTNNPNGDRVIYKYLYRLAKIISKEELQALAKETLEKMINSGKPESILQNIDERHFAISDDMGDLILKYTEKAISILVSQGREEEVFNYALNFHFVKMTPMLKIFGPIIIDVLKKPGEKVYEALLSAPDYYLYLSLMDRTKFEDVLYDVALEAAKDRDLMRLLFDNAGVLRKFLGDKTGNIWDECEKTDPVLFEELHGLR